MTFQAYLDNIKEKTGKTPDDFKKEMTAAGVYKPEMKATEFVNWMKKEYDLGRGHSMAIWHYFTGKGWVSAVRTTAGKKPAAKKTTKKKK
jgi:hypothetical protein